MSASKQPERMTADEFLAWSETQPGRYELHDGLVFRMAAERLGHVRVKARIFQRLSEAVAAAGLPCEAFIDGVAVRVDADRTYEPDALVRCGTPLGDDTLTITDPLIVVEVVSPSSTSLDAGAKMLGYLRMPSVRHYLLLYPEERVAVHHCKDEAGTITTRILPGDELRLDPPGLVLRDFI